MKTPEFRSEESLVLALAALVLLSLGLWGSLFGPSPMRLLSVAGIVLFILAGTGGGEKSTDGRLVPMAGCLALFRPEVERWRRPLSVAMRLCPIVAVSVWLLGGVVVWLVWGRGHTDLTRPVFEPRPVYESHWQGETTHVPRAAHLVAATTFVVAWHLGWIGGVTWILHRILFGEDPPWLAGVSKAGKPKGKGVDPEGF